MHCSTSEKQPYFLNLFSKEKTGRNVLFHYDYCFCSLFYFAYLTEAIVVVLDIYICIYIFIYLYSHGSNLFFPFSHIGIREEGSSCYPCPCFGGIAMAHLWKPAVYSIASSKKGMGKEARRSEECNASRFSQLVLPSYSRRCELASRAGGSREQFYPGTHGRSFS